MTDKAANLLSPAQRETLRHAMKDAVYYRDPPVECAECPPDGLCKSCSETFARATSYLELSNAMDLDAGEE
jgi:hypothetical protein